jgi:pSer/pThr/pTyr-binding forkhead associated (FHA) protein
MMAKLILSMDGLVLKEIALTKERTTIGRKPHNDIQIDNLAISGEHAAIVTILSDSFLEDLNSTNGTYVNGQPVKKHFLKDNDVVELGKYRLKFVNEVVSTATTDYEKAPALDIPKGSPMAGAPVPRSPTDTQVGMRPSTQYTTTAADVQQQSVGVVKILSGGNAGKSLDLSKTLTTLGKPGVQVAVITRRPQGYFLTHVEGAQFPVVNGRTIDAQAYPLADHDVIELAGVKMEFFLRS